MRQSWANSWIWGLRPITAALFTIIVVAAVGPWGLFAAWPLALIIAVGVLHLVRDRRSPVDAEIRRVSDQAWAMHSAEAAHDPHLERTSRRASSCAARGIQSAARLSPRAARRLTRLEVGLWASWSGGAFGFYSGLSRGGITAAPRIRSRTGTSGAVLRSQSRPFSALCTAWKSTRCPRPTRPLGGRHPDRKCRSASPRAGRPQLGISSRCNPEQVSGRGRIPSLGRGTGLVQLARTDLDKRQRRDHLQTGPRAS